MATNERDIADTPQGELAKYFYFGQWDKSPETISGSGSTLSYTNLLRPQLKSLLDKYNIQKLVDGACGDFNWMKEVVYDGMYIGIDIVPEIIAENRRRYRRENRRFRVGDITKDKLPNADMIMVRDCLFHLPYRYIAQFFSNFLRSNINWLLVTSHANEVNTDLAVPGKFRALNLLLQPFNLPNPGEDRRLVDFVDGFPERHMYLWKRDEIVTVLQRAAIEILGKEAELPLESSVPAAKSFFKEFHYLDKILIANKYFRQYFRQSKWKQELIAIVETSYEKLGFFTSHAPRAFEYPWVFAQATRSGGVVIDLGAGLNPLPFMMAEYYHTVITVDYSKDIRILKFRDGWNEWGYLDYSLLDGRIQSRNMDFAELGMEHSVVDLIYSVSVIEHMPAGMRRRVIKKTADLLKPGGRLLLTLDLVPGSLKLWNRDRGKLVEDADIHGSLPSFLEELEDVGLQLQSVKIERDLPGAFTDICCMSAWKKVTK